MTAPTVFISYSHKDEEWKDRLVTHLGVLAQEGLLDTWDDRRIEVGDNWRPEIENAISRASIVILMVSANFLTSKFILDEELPKFFARRDKDGLRIIPLIIKPCAWQQVGWLSKIQGRPKDNRPLSAGNESQIDADLAALANEIAGIIKRAGVVGAKTSEVSKASEVWKIPPDKISLAKLPSTSSDLFGREKELQELNEAWMSGVIANPEGVKQSPQNKEIASAEEHHLAMTHKINIVSLVAWGGVGKTALVNKWLSGLGEGYGGAERVFGWSFYSQGAAEGRQVSADQFIATALAWFGDPDPNTGSPWDKGERLADLIKQQRTLLVLDGLEPLQNPPPVETGKIKDPGLTSLLRELARQNPGLVVITTRLPVDDLKDFVIASRRWSSNAEGVYRDQAAVGSVLQRDLDNLSPAAGAAYLKHLGVDGTDKERQDASTDFGGHALALTLVGSYLKVVHGGDIRKHHEIPRLTDERKQGAHARRVLQSYERWLKGKPELDILRLMGLFDRPAEKGALDALRKKPAIKGLTDALQKLSDADWKFAVNNLQELHLLARPSTTPLRGYAQDEELDCHPLLREHFGEQLKAANTAAWREANSRLYEYYKASAKELPDTLQEMAPLFAAVLHGCQAGKYKEALSEIYWKRIQRGNESFNTKKLGALSAEVAALSNFFEGTSWRKPVDGLGERLKSFVSNEAGYDLRALGRLIEAAQPMQTSLETDIANNDWKNAAIDASNLSELFLTIGDVQQALAYAEKNVELADRSGDAFTKIANKAKHALVLHQAGRLTEAEAAFSEAEEIEKKTYPEYPRLTSLQGFNYCELLLSQGKYQEVSSRANQNIELARQQGILLDVALGNLSLGRATPTPALPRSQMQRTGEGEALTYLNRAVDGLRQAGQQQFIPLGLLARAEYYRTVGELDKSQRDLDEAFAIASRGGMGLFLADCHLGYARLIIRAERSVALSLSKGRSEEDNKTTDDRQRTMDEAREHLKTAKEMIDKMGYHRRDKEVEELEKELNAIKRMF